MLKDKKYYSSQLLQVLKKICSEIHNMDQWQLIFEEVSQSVENGVLGIYFVQGIGGSGKSTLCKQLWLGQDLEINFALTVLAQV